MDLNGVPLFSLLSGRMSWLSHRQSLLAQNVANADTPNYVARDMKAMNFERLLTSQSSGNGLSVTNARHIAPLSSSAGGDEEDSVGGGSSPTGNTVSIEQEMIKLSDTQVQYQAATNIYQKAVNMFRTALGGRG